MGRSSRNENGGKGGRNLQATGERMYDAHLPLRGTAVGERGGGEEDFDAGVRIGVGGWVFGFGCRGW